MMVIEKNRKSFNACVILLTLVLSSVTFGASYYFDFGYEGDLVYGTETPAPGYTLVGAQHTGGFAKAYNAIDGYGWINAGDVKARKVIIGYGASIAKLNSGVYLRGETFQADVNDGDYILELAGGMPYAIFAKYEISGDGGTSWTLIGRDASLPGYTGNPMPYTYEYDEQGATWPRVGDYAADTFNVSPNHYLQGKDIPMTVTAGYILVKGYQDGSGGTAISYLDIFDTAGLSITVDDPNGGEEIVAGSNYQISWTTGGSISDVMIEYSIDAGVNWQDVVPANTGNTGSYDWLVAQIISTNVLIRISHAAFPNINDTSDAVFTIYECFEVDLNGDCIVDFKDLDIVLNNWLECTHPDCD